MIAFGDGEESRWGIVWKNLNIPMAIQIDDTSLTSNQMCSSEIWVRWNLCVCTQWRSDRSGSGNLENSKRRELDKSYPAAIVVAWQGRVASDERSLTLSGVSTIKEVLVIEVSGGDRVMLSYHFHLCWHSIVPFEGLLMLEKDGRVIMTYLLHQK